MSRLTHFQLLAKYNHWMNVKVYAHVSELPETTITKDMGAFFKSILGTLNHILVADIIWLQRFAQHPKNYPALDYVKTLRKPERLDQMMHDNLDDLYTHRQTIDTDILHWVDQMEDQDLDHHLTYANMKGVVSIKNFSELITHFFNHQTHHRGQVSTLLSQHGVDIGITDLLSLISEHEN